MAYDNIEIEIKIKISKDEFDAIKERITSIGIFKNTTQQIDTYFSPNSENYLAEKYPYKWLSLRERGGKKILNFKHFFPEGAEKHTHGNEFETEISNTDAMKAIFHELGIAEIVEVNKTRETYVIDDKYEIVLDSVANLGYFLEIEALKNIGNPEETKQHMINFLNSIGISELNIDYRGYPFQLLKLNKEI